MSASSKRYFWASVKTASRGRPALNDERTLEFLADLAEFLDSEGKQCAIAGAVALAVHGYVRATDDYDYAVVTANPRELFERVKVWLPKGFTLDYVLPDSEDPLGGVAMIEGPEISTVELVNFFNPANPRSNPGGDAIATARPEPTLGGLRVVTPEYLIALKLYAGSIHDLSDASRLIEHMTASLDWALIERVARKFAIEERLDELKRHLTED